MASFLSEIDTEGWLRFFIALLGLIFSFGFAVLSTSFRDQGNVWGTAFTASLALLTAGIVGLTTVPYLARRITLERVRYAVRYDLTREGLAYLAVVMIIGIAALNTGNNLLFIVVAAMLAAILVSGIASTVVLIGIKLDVALPEHVFAGKPFLGRITLRNAGRLPSFSVSVVPQKPTSRRKWRWQPATLGIPPFRPPERQWFRIPDLQLRPMPRAWPGPAILSSPVYFPYLAPRRSESALVELNFPLRGRYFQKGLGLATRFPFSFLTKTRIVPFERELIVLPAVEPTQEFLTILPALRGEFEVFVAGRGYDLYRLRELSSGDPARHIDWKATARAQTVMVREFTREDERKLRIVFDNPAPEIIGENDYEAAVRLAASLAWHFADGSTELSFCAPGFTGSQEALAFLKYLAVVEPAESLILENMPKDDAYNLIITARQRGSIPTQLWMNSYFIFIGEKAGRIPASESSSRT